MHRGRAKPARMGASADDADYTPASDAAPARGGATPASEGGAADEQLTSGYRGVTRHCRTGRFEAHVSGCVGAHGRRRQW